MKTHEAECGSRCRRPQIGGGAGRHSKDRGWDSHGNPTLSSWPHIPAALSAPPNSILSLLQDEPPWTSAEGSGLQFPISQLCSNRSPLRPWGAGSRKSLPRMPKSMDAQGPHRQRPVPTEPHTHRAHGHQAHCTNSSSSSQADNPTCPKPPQLNKCPLFFFFLPHRTACGILVPRPWIEPVPPAKQIALLSTDP